MGLRDLARSWNYFGATNPFGAILGGPDHSGQPWSLEQFFDSGRVEIAGAIAQVAAVMSPGHGCALDFGCGLGRVTQPLADYFEEVYGVDIAPSMIAGAVEHNRHGDRCKFVLNQEPHLRRFPDGKFDLIYSRITLQHLPPRYIRIYIEEFVRIAAPGGAIVFGLPSERARLWHRIAGPAVSSLGRTFSSIVSPHKPRIDMYAIGRRKIVRLLEDSGAKVVAVEPDRSAGPAWTSFLYFATKPRSGAAGLPGR